VVLSKSQKKKKRTRCSRISAEADGVGEEVKRKAGGMRHGGMEEWERRKKGREG
jgi:hypothetical protein